MKVRPVRFLPVFLLVAGLVAGRALHPSPAYADEPNGGIIVQSTADDEPELRTAAPDEAPLAAGGDDGAGFLGVVVDHGSDVLDLAFAALAAFGSWLLFALGLSLRVRALFAEVAACARRAVLDVWAVYVKGIKAGREDGRLTAEEKATAKRHAIARLRELLGWRAVLVGGGVLARIFAGRSWATQLETALASAVETAVSEAKRDGKVAGMVTKGTRVDVVGLPLRAPAEPPPLPL